MPVLRLLGVAVLVGVGVFTYMKQVIESSPIVSTQQESKSVIQRAEVTLVPDRVTSEALVEQLQESTRQVIAGIISRHHYLQPDYQLVFQQTSSLDSVQKYLSTLDAYSRVASADEMEFAKKRNQAKRVGPGVDFLFDGPDVLVFPIYSGEFVNKGSKTAVLLESVNAKKLDVADFHSYEFLSDIKENDTVDFIVSSPQQTDAWRVTTTARLLDNAPVRYYKKNEAVVLEVRQFRSGYTGLVRSAIEDAYQAKLFVIDLRFSPGGDIYAMTDWLSLLLPENQLISFLHTKRYTDPTQLRTLSGELPLATPIYILISRFTASSAEIFARVLESTRGEQVRLVGKPTKGKCLAQKSFTVNSSFSMLLSTHEVLLADGKSCNGQRLHAEFELEQIEFKSIEEILSSIQ